MWKIWSWKVIGSRVLAYFEIKKDMHFFFFLPKPERKPTQKFDSQFKNTLVFSYSIESSVSPISKTSSHFSKIFSNVVSYIKQGLKTVLLFFFHSSPLKFIFLFKTSPTLDLKTRPAGQNNRMLPPSCSFLSCSLVLEQNNIQIWHPTPTIK